MLKSFSDGLELRHIIFFVKTNPYLLGLLQLIDAHSELLVVDASLPGLGGGKHVAEVAVVVALDC